MKYVILRDDDVNATTPVWKLEMLYRPFLARGLDVHLAMIPAVKMNIRRRDGFREAFLDCPEPDDDREKPIAENPKLLEYLRHNPAYIPVVHGFHHAFIDGSFEFNRDEPEDIARRLDNGLALFKSAGLGRPEAFVAPQDQCSRAAVIEIMKRFRILSLQYLNRHRLPLRYWPTYFRQKKSQSRRHFRLGTSIILSHPGCLLSRDKATRGMLDRLLQSLRDDDVTVIVSHHWEFFYPNDTVNVALIEVLHAFAEYLGTASDVRVIRMEEAPTYIR